MARDTYKYHFKVDNKTVHTGITNDLGRRELEHQRDIAARATSFRLGMPSAENPLWNGKRSRESGASRPARSGRRPIQAWRQLFSRDTGAR